MPNTILRRRAALPLAAAGTALALVACGSDGADSADDTAAEGTDSTVALDDLVEAPVPDEPPLLDPAELPAQPDASVPYSEFAAWAVLAGVSEHANATDPDATAECPDLAAAGDTGTCDVTFLGLELEYPITYVEDASGSMGVDVDYAEVPSVREVVEDFFRHSEQTEAVRCAMDDVVTVVPGEQAEYFCYKVGGPEWDPSTADEVYPYEAHVIMGGAMAFSMVLDTGE